MSPELQTGLILFGIATLVGWNVWLTKAIMRYDRKVEDMTEIKKDLGIYEARLNISLEKSENKQKEMESRVTVSLDNFDKTLHLWKDTMINELKSIVKDERSNRGGQRTSR